MILLSADQETIIAQCTPQGSGALALLRLSGIDAINIATNMSVLASKKKLLNVPTHTIHYGKIVDENNACIDQVLFLLMREPQTFTGQNTVEITCHNNPFIIEQIISRAIASGARLAKEGEFTKRAVLNDKIDLIQAEAINELIHANTQMSLKHSLAQLQGSFSHWVDTLTKNLLKALALCEASFEFIDEEITFDKQIIDIINNTCVTIDAIKKTFDKQQHIRTGIRIAILGSVNAGKSSLFNALLDKERAIVTNIAGTTRDVIEAGLYKNGNYWTVIDTAGLRQTDDIIEQEGVKRSFEQAQLADIIVLVFDSSRLLTTSEQKVYTQLLTDYTQKIIPVYNKVDKMHAQYKKNQSDYIALSTKTNQGLETLECQIQKKIDSLFQEVASPFLLNQRQFNLLLGLEKKLHVLTDLFSHEMHYELISYHLQDALSLFTELTGKTISEQGMDAVFREFCVGK